MKLLRCKLCHGEMDVIGNERATHKKVKCRQCGYSNETIDKLPEVVVLRKRPYKEV